MECPKCKTMVYSTASSCPKCGISFSLLDELQTIKKNHTYIQELAKNLLNKIEITSHSIQALEKRYLNIHSLPIEKEKSKPETEIKKTESVKNPSGAHLDDKRIINVESKESIKINSSRESEINFGQKWLLIAGIFIMVFGVGYFLKYSFSKDWISPAIRVMFVFLSGGGLMLLGEYFRKKLSENFGLYLVGGGIAVLYFASFASCQVYKILGQIPSFGLMILITCGAVILSVYYNTKWLSVLGLTGGFLTPAMLSTGADNQIGLMSYMVILNVGILYISMHKQWNLLNILSFIFTWLLFSGWYFAHYNSEKFVFTMIFLNIFFLIYAIIPFIYYFVKERTENVKGLFLTVPNAYFAISFSYPMIQQLYGIKYVSVVTLLYSAMFLFMANLLSNKGYKNKEPVILLTGKACFFLILTIPVLLDGPWITVFWLVQSWVLYWASNKLENKLLLRSAFILFGLSVIKFFFNDYPDIFKLNYYFILFKIPHITAGYSYLLKERLLVSAFVLITPLIKYYLSVPAKESFIDRKTTQSYLLFFFGIFLFIILNVEVNSFFYSSYPKARFASISVLWAVFSACLMYAGFINRKSMLRKCSLSLFILTVLKVFIIDMANISTPYRILSFMVLGIMMIFASFLYYRFKDKILEDSAS